MKVVRLIFFILICTQNAVAFDKYTGCYKTLEIDGSRPAGENSFSTIEAGVSPVFYDFERKALDHVIINLYLGSENEWKSYHPFVLFPELGKIEQKKKKLRYSMNDDVIFLDNYRPTRVDHNVNLHLNKTQEGLLKGHISFWSNSRNMEGKRAFILEPVGCSL